MNLELLRTFLEVERCRHFGRAAEELHLTQAAVSARIRQLEENLGVRLFERKRRDIQLTPPGHRLLRHADLLLADWRKARQDVSLGGTAEQIAIGGSLRLWETLLQDWLQQLRADFPDLAIIAESHTPDLLIRRLLDGALDVAVMLEPAQLQALHIRPVATVDLLLVSTRAGQSLASAQGDGYIYVDWGLTHAVEHRRRFPGAQEARTRVSQARMARRLLAQIDGAAYLPSSMIREDLEEGRLMLVDDAPVLSYTAFAVYPAGSARAELVEHCLEHVPTLAPPPIRS